MTKKEPKNHTMIMNFNMNFRNFVRRKIYRQYYRFSNIRKPDNFIILFSHQRAGSTLFTKILCSNPEVLGYGESHLAYRSKGDIKAVSGKILYVLREWLRENSDKIEKMNFFFDKSLFNYYTLTGEPKFFLVDNIHIIFLIREPHGALPSIMNLARRGGPHKPKSEERGACDYYIRRLNGLVESALFFQKNKKPFFIMTYQHILFDTENLFKHVESFLSLNHSLTEEYDIISDRLGSGDQSTKLKSGKINRNKKTKSDIVISEEILEESQLAYDNALEKLSSAGISIFS